ncbi:MAG: translation elongation factor Ts [Bacteroidota bacterium]
MISAQNINKLRQQTGAGMMDCKKALIEAAGDFDKAIEILRKKGQKVSTARADRATTEGIVLAQTNDAHDYGVVLALSCETDFVAKNEIFQQLGQTILDVAFTHRPATLEELLALKVDNLTIQEKIIEVIGKIGEKVAITAYVTLSSETVVSYIHMGNKLGVLVGLQGSRIPQVVEAGRDVAMQIAAMAPLAVDKDGIDKATLDRELAIAKEQVRNAGMPEMMLDKIAQGRLNKFFKESVLLAQPFVKNNKITTAQYLASVAPNLTVVAFERVTTT